MGKGWLAVALLPLAMSSPAWATGEAVNGFPNWQERVMHEWTNRARCDPAVEMTACGSSCGDAACYTPQPPLPWEQTLNHSARFHSDELKAQNYFAHDSQCTLVSNIDALFPGSCTGAASCACVGGTQSCNTVCTSWSGRVALFGGSPSGEIIASYADPDGAFYQWLFEPYSPSTCGYNQGPPTNGHRWNILKSSGAVGFGEDNGAPSVGDFGGGGASAKLISGSHYPRSGSTVDAWTNWNDTAGPKTAYVDVDGTCTAMTLTRGVATNGAYHAALTGLTGCHRYFFLFTDSASNVVTYPTTGSLGIGAAGSCADWDTTRPATSASCSCTPQCNGKQCGDDGCGGACGNCSGSTTCQNGQCIGPTDGGVPDAGDAGASKDAGNPISDASVAPDAGTSNGSSGGCGCVVAGGERSSHAAIVAALAMLAALARRRQVR